jgi:hypothetical protein
MALLGRIDEVVCHGTLKDETVKMIESFLPGTTGIGQRGWYGELELFLQRKELLPRDEATGDTIRRSGPVVFPSYTDALAELRAAPTLEEKAASPSTRSRALYAATILSKAALLEEGELPVPPGWDPSQQVPDPLDELMPTLVRSTSEPLPPIPNIETPPTGDPVEDLKAALREVRSPAEYAAVTAFVAKAGVDPELADVLDRPVVCTGALRKIDGKFCTVLTTSWDSPFTLAQIKKIIDPLNWPDLCDFFVTMDPQTVRTPDASLGWSRVLESVSGDPKQWQMRTALRYWKGVVKDKDGSETGIYVNYDLDELPRVGDCKLLEVDAGFIWATPHTPGDDKSLVRIRTSKQVRIRGVSLTATAAMACGFGWGDAMSQMFGETPATTKQTWSASVLQAKPSNAGQSTQKQPSDSQTEDEIDEAAEDVELLVGWRGAIIKAMQTQMTAGIERAKSLGTDFAVRWSDGDGFSQDDVNKFGTRYGKEMTEYATGMFEAAGAALQPKRKKADANEGND